MKKKRIYEHMHVHYFPLGNGRCICGKTLDELLAQQKEKIEKLKPLFTVF